MCGKEHIPALKYRLMVSKSTLKYTNTVETHWMRKNFSLPAELTAVTIADSYTLLSLSKISHSTN